MTMNDPLANVYSAIQLYDRLGKRVCTVKPSSRIIKENLKILHDLGYLGEFKEIKDNKGGIIVINLLGSINKCGVVKPRYAVKNNNYEKFEKRFLPSREIGILIVSTPQGIMTHAEAKNKKLGGKLLAYCY